MRSKILVTTLLVSLLLQPLAAVAKGEAQNVEAVPRFVRAKNRLVVYKIENGVRMPTTKLDYKKFGFRLADIEVISFKDLLKIPRRAPRVNVLDEATTDLGLLKNRGFVDLNNTDAVLTAPKEGETLYAVNNIGGSVVTYNPPSGGTQGGVYVNGTLQRLPTLGGISSIPSDINDDGVVVGRSDVSEGDDSGAHAFMWKSGVIEDLGTLGGLESFASAVNHKGQIVGYSTVSNKDTENYQAFMWDKGTMKNISSNAWKKSLAHDINEDGTVVGDFVSANSTISVVHPFLRKIDGTIQELTLPERMNGGSARHINSRGDVVGVGYFEHVSDFNPELKVPLEAYVSSVLVWMDGKVIDISSLLPYEEVKANRLKIFDVKGINDKRQVLVLGWRYNEASPRAFLIQL